MGESSRVPTLHQLCVSFVSDAAIVNLDNCLDLVQHAAAGNAAPLLARAEAEAARLVADSDAVGATSSEIFTSYSPTHANVRTLSPAATAASTDLLL